MSIVHGESTVQGVSTVYMVYALSATHLVVYFLPPVLLRRPIMAGVVVHLDEGT
jgi:hypothetical protein